MNVNEKFEQIKQICDTVNKKDIYQIEILSYENGKLDILINNCYDGELAKRMERYRTNLSCRINDLRKGIDHCVD